jgi:hypothetical protein
MRHAATEGPVAIGNRRTETWKFPLKRYTLEKGAGLSPAGAKVSRNALEVAHGVGQNSDPPSA